MAMCVHVHVEIGVYAEWWYNTYRGDGRGHVCVCSCISILGGGVCVWCMWGCRCVRRCVSHIGVYWCTTSSPR